MKIKLIFLCLFIASILRAQYTLQVIRPNELAMKTADIWNCIIQNNSNSTNLTYIHGIATEAKKGRLVEARSADFTLATGITQFNTRNYESLKEATKIFSDKNFEEHIVRTNSLPNGDYTVCITLIETQSNRNLAQNCLQFQVNKVTPSVLVSPRDKSEICEQNPYFVWSPYLATYNASTISYKIHLVEILSNQKANSAIKTNPCFYCESFIQSPPHQYPFHALPFKDGSSYAWYVVVMEGKKEISKSDVWQFKWKDCNIGNQEDVVEEEEKKPLNENKRVKGLGYYYLNNFENSEVVKLSKKQLNIVIDNTIGFSELSYYCFSNPNNILGEDQLSLTSNKNYFSIDLNKFPLKANEVYKFQVLFPTGEFQSINFLINPNLK